MKINKIAKITMFSSLVVSIVNLFTDIDLSVCVYLLIISSLLCYWIDEMDARWESVTNEHKAVIRRIIAETIVCDIETEIIERDELWNKRELLEMIERNKKRYEDFEK